MTPNIVGMEYKGRDIPSGNWVLFVTKTFNIAETMKLISTIALKATVEYVREWDKAINGTLKNDYSIAQSQMRRLRENQNLNEDFVSFAIEKEKQNTPLGTIAVVSYSDIERKFEHGGPDEAKMKLFEGEWRLAGELTVPLIEKAEGPKKKVTVATALIAEVEKIHGDIKKLTASAAPRVIDIDAAFKDKTAKTLIDAMQAHLVTPRFWGKPSVPRDKILAYYGLSWQQIGSASADSRTNLIGALANLARELKDARTKLEKEVEEAARAAKAPPKKRGILAFPGKRVKKTFADTRAAVAALSKHYEALEKELDPQKENEERVEKLEGVAEDARERAEKDAEKNITKVTELMHHTARDMAANFKTFLSLKKAAYEKEIARLEGQRKEPRAEHEKKLLDARIRYLKNKGLENYKSTLELAEKEVALTKDLRSIEALVSKIQVLAVRERAITPGENFAARTNKGLRAFYAKFRKMPEARKIRDKVMRRLATIFKYSVSFRQSTNLMLIFVRNVLGPMFYGVDEGDKLERDLIKLAEAAR